MVVLDTSVIIDHLRCRGKRKSVLDLLDAKFSRGEMGISIMTIQELYEGESTLDLDREREMLAVVGSLEVWPYTYEVAKKAGELARDLSVSIEAIDAAIAATCLVNDCELVTLDAKDFAVIIGLKVNTGIVVERN